MKEHVFKCVHGSFSLNSTSKEDDLFVLKNKVTDFFSSLETDSTKVTSLQSSYWYYPEDKEAKK